MLCLQKNGITIRESEKQALLDLGLNATQARVYLCLAILGNSNAKTLTECSKVPRQDIYRVLKELFDVGLIQKEFAKPTEFRAMPVKYGLDILAHRLDRKTRIAHKTAAKALSGFGKYMVAKNSQALSNLVLVPEQEPIVLKAQELLNSAIYSLQVLSPARNLFPWILEQKKLFRKALERNVKFQLITDRTENGKALKQTLTVFRNNTDFELRMSPEPLSLSFGVYDRKKLIIELSAVEGYLQSQALVSENFCLLELALAYFESAWNRAGSNQSMFPQAQEFSDTLLQP